MNAATAPQPEPFYIGIGMSYYKDLEHYGIIGDLETSALIGDDGSIDWCCLPHIESPSVFAAILDESKGGRFSLTPTSSYSSEQRYVPDTNVLETYFQTDEGSAVLLDFMPVKSGSASTAAMPQAIYRKLTCTQGMAHFNLEFSPRFNYAREATRLVASKRGVGAVSLQQRLSLQSDAEFVIRGASAKARVALNQGEKAWFILNYGGDSIQTEGECESTLQATIEFWKRWVDGAANDAASFTGKWHDLIVRSSLVLKLLAHEQAGAICAAPTTSLPEVIGGERNWDYRYNWIRDASFTVQALYNIGHHDEARRHLRWFVDICRRNPDPSKIQIMYGMHGETDLKEIELNHLEGYRKSKPVRIGNGAAKQKQLDIFGELINAIYETERYGDAVPEGDLEFVARIADYVCDVWNTPDSGIWEVRGGPHHFVYSKLMCWVALDRGMKIVERKKISLQTGRWERVRDEIKKAILEKGYNEKLGSFVQSFGSVTLDATSLLIPIMELLPVHDARVQGTINATLEKLTTKSGLVYRYLGEDGLTGKEGAFVLCSFWLIKALALSGRVEEAEDILDKVVRHAGKTGLFSEEIDPETGRQLGNLPQAFSHIGLINSVLYLEHMKGKLHAGPAPTGTH